LGFPGGEISDVQFEVSVINLSQDTENSSSCCSSISIIPPRKRGGTLRFQVTLPIIVSATGSELLTML
jgi:hypothetical protein